MNIACFHLNQVGDLVFSLPALKSVRDSDTEARITSIVRPGAKDLIESSGLVDEVILRPTGAKLSKLSLAVELSSRRFDLALVFSQSAECAVLAGITRAPRRIGFVNTSLGSLLTQRVDFSHPPSTANNLRLIEAAGFRPTTTSYAGLLKPTPAQSERAAELLAERGVGESSVIAVLAPGTSGRRSLKEWSDSGFAAVGRHLIRRGCAVAVVGTEPADSVAAQCPGLIDLGGRTSLGDVVGVIARASVLVAVDSGILHIGAAVGVRVVGLYGPSSPEITGPQGEGHTVLTSGADCSPCVRTVCKYNRKCMTDISIDAVIAAVDSTLSDPGIRQTLERDGQ